MQQPSLFAAKTELEQDAFELAKLCFKRPDTLVLMVLTESSALGNWTRGVGGNQGDANSLVITQFAISPACLIYGSQVLIGLDFIMFFGQLTVIGAVNFVERI